MKATRIYLLGGGQSDFAQNHTRDGGNLRSLFSHTLRQALDQSQIEPVEVEVAHVGNFVAELFCGQGHLGGFFADVDPAFVGMPASRHEGACASGSLALLAAMADLEAGRYGLACVLGIELMRNVSGVEAGAHLGAAALVPEEVADVDFPWPHFFSELGEEYDRRYGLRYEHLMALSRQAFANAKLNPWAQARSWQFEARDFTEDEARNPVITGRIRKQDCSQITDGAAVLFLAREDTASAWAKQRGLSLEQLPYIRGWGHHTDCITLKEKLQRSSGERYVFPLVRKTVTDAFRRAGLSDASQLDAIETHDCFTTTWYMAIDHFGLTEPGDSWKAIEDERITRGGLIPMNPGGGLMGIGHPVGATGVRMMLDAYRQLTGQAGDFQLDQVRNVATLNIGGSATTSVCFVASR